VTWPDDRGFKYWQGQQIFPLSKNIQSSSGTHPASYSMGEDMRMITYLHLVLRLRMGGAIPPFPLHVFMVYVENRNLFFNRKFRVAQLSSAMSLLNTLPDVPYTFGTSNDLHLHNIILCLWHTSYYWHQHLHFPLLRHFYKKKTEQNGIRTVQTLLYRLISQCYCNTSAQWQADIVQGHSIRPTGTVTILFNRN